MPDVDLTDGEGELPPFFGRFDVLADPGRCGAPDESLFVLVPERYIVGFASAPDDEQVALLGKAARVRWMYRQLGLAEVDQLDHTALSSVPGVVAATPVWKAVGSTRVFAVGFNSLSAFSRRQASDPEAFFRHPTGIGYPILTQVEGRTLIDLDPAVELPTAPALVPVINFSVGTASVPYPTSAGDIVDLATAAASREVLIVVAAGNCGSAADDSMSAWARPDWVLSVGATHDEEGRVIAPYSSRGRPGPDVVALGRSALNYAKTGTSFAAPRVTALARLVVAAFCELDREVLVAQGGPASGVPAVSYGIIDDFGDEIWDESPDSTVFQALPLVGVRTAVVAEMVELTGQSLRISTTPSIVREVIISSAREVPGASRAEAGAGYVDESGLIARLAELTAADVFAWFGDGEAPDQDRLRELHPFDREGLVKLASAVRITGPTVRFDFKGGRWAPTPVIDKDLAAQHPLGLPIDLTGIRLVSG